MTRDENASREAALSVNNASLNLAQGTYLSSCANDQAVWHFRR
jgi:hypothetical protein